MDTLPAVYVLALARVCAELDGTARSLCCCCSHCRLRRADSAVLSVKLRACFLLCRLELASEFSLTPKHLLPGGLLGLR